MMHTDLGEKEGEEGRMGRWGKRGGEREAGVGRLGDEGLTGVAGGVEGGWRLRRRGRRG